VQWTFEFLLFTDIQGECPEAIHHAIFDTICSLRSFFEEAIVLSELNQKRAAEKTSEC
jgi:hypothetical protein